MVTAARDGRMTRTKIVGTSPFSNERKQPRVRRRRGMCAWLACSRLQAQAASFEGFSVPLELHLFKKKCLSSFNFSARHELMPISPSSPAFV